MLRDVEHYPQYAPRLADKAHQVEAKRRACGRHAFAFLLEMGTGKTKIVLDEFAEDVRHTPNLLVIAPAGSYANWFLDREGEPSEATKHLDPALRSRLLVANWRSGAGAPHLQKLAAFVKMIDRPRMLVVNIEALSTVKAARDLCQKFLLSANTLMVVDESTRIRNLKAKRTKYVLALGELAHKRRILTGLVSPKSPLDLYAQFLFLDPNIIGARDFYDFRATYAITHKEWFPGAAYPTVIVDGYRNLDDLARRIEPWSYRVLKEQCLDLEPKTYQTRDVPLTTMQRWLYKELRENATAEIQEGQHVTAPLVITQLLRLHQLLCGYTVDEQGKLVEVDEARTDALIELLDEHEGKAIIWVNYDHSVQKLVTRLQQTYGEASVAAFWGGNRSTRLADEGRFKTDPACRFMVSTMDSGGVGNNWTAANLVVYYSNGYNLELRAQSEDRAHRVGQTRAVTYVDLVARGTVDEKILHALREKIDLATQITGDNYREWVV